MNKMKPDKKERGKKKIKNKQTKKTTKTIARHGNYILKAGNNKEIHQTTGPIVLAPSGRLQKGN